MLQTVSRNTKQTEDGNLIIDETTVNSTISLIRRQIYNRDPSNFTVQNETSQKKILKVLREGGIVLIVGPRGVGKSALVNFCLRQFEIEQKNEEFKILSINGLHIHDPTKAMMSLVQQFIALQRHEKKRKTTAPDMNNSMLQEQNEIVKRRHQIDDESDTSVEILSPSFSSHAEDSHSDVEVRVVNETGDISLELDVADKVNIVNVSESNSEIKIVTPHDTVTFPQQEVNLSFLSNNSKQIKSDDEDNENVILIDHTITPNETVSVHTMDSDLSTNFPRNFGETTDAATDVAFQSPHVTTASTVKEPIFEQQNEKNFQNEGNNEPNQRNKISTICGQNAVMLSTPPHHSKSPRRPHMTSSSVCTSPTATTSPLALERNFHNIVNSFQRLLATEQMTKVIVVVDEFDLFLQSQRQSFIYSLLECMNTKPQNFSLIAISSRLDVIDLLEKRVRSRFLQEQITIEYCTNFEHFLTIIKRMFIPNVTSTISDTQHSNFSNNDNSKQFLPAHSEFFFRFISKLNGLFEDQKFRLLMQQMFDWTRNIWHYQTLCELVLTRLDTRHLFLTVEDFKFAVEFMRRDFKVEILKDLSILELFLVVAASKVEFIRKIDNYTFQHIYEEYRRFVSQSGRTHFRYEKPLCFKAFEHIVELSIVKPTRTNIQNTQLPKAFWPIHLNVTLSHITDALRMRQRCPLLLQQWAFGTVDE
jgi:Cdc6-like AAA superfamily ATPase